MARVPSRAVDPAADAAALLRRLGFAALMLAVPIAAMMTRRAVVVLVPVGIALLVIAAALDRGHAGFRAGLRRLALSRGAAAGGLVLLWCALSLAWTPFLGPATGRLLSIVATVGLALAGYLALPDRMRSADLYIIPVGAAAAALAAIGLALFGGAGAEGLESEGQSLERGLVVLVLFVWPAIAWLHSRDRQLEALGLALVVAAGAFLGPATMPVAALGVGAAVYAVTALWPRVGVAGTAVMMAGLLALAPALPLVVRPLAALAFGTNSNVYQSLSIWRSVMLNEPARLFTGHGFETALRGRFVGLLAPNAPSTLLFEAWYELGIVGALAGAAALYWSVLAAGRDHPPLVPGVMAAFATVFAFACFGIGTAQMWWFTSIAALVLIFVAAERGQFRTTRPKATFFARPKAANDA
jgi:hypothetical protein